MTSAVAAAAMARPVQGAREHARERTDECVSARAERATREWAARAVA